MRLALSGWRLAAVKPLALVGLLSWAVQAWSPAFTTSAGIGQVELLQASILQSEKFDVRSGIRDALQWLFKTRDVACATWPSAESFLAALQPGWRGCACGPACSAWSA